MQHYFHRRIALVKRAGNRAAAVAIHAQSELGHVVGADGETVEILQELLGQQSIARHFAHHNQTQTVFAALEAIGFERFNHLLGFAQGAHKRHHNLNVGEPHIVAHAFERFAFERKAIFEIIRHITRRTAEAQHRVFFVRLVNIAAEQIGVFVGFEIRHAHNGFARIHRCGQRGHALGDFVDIKSHRRSIAGNAFVDFSLQIGVLFVEFNQGFGVDADLAVDDEFHARQADAFAGQAGKRESQLRVAHVHHDFHRRFGHFIQSHIGNFHIQQACVNQAGVAFGARHGNFLSLGKHAGGIAAAHHGRNAQLARNNGGVAGAAAAVGHNCRSALHHRLPIGVGHVGNQNIARFNGVHFRGVFHQAHFALADFLADGAAFAQHFFLAVDRIAAQAAATLFLRFHGFRARLQDVELAVGAVAAPFDVHRAAVMLLDNQRILRQLGHFGIADRKLLACRFVHIHHLHGFTCLRLVGEGHFNQLGAHGFAQNRRFAGFQSGLVHIEFIRVDCALHHGFTQAV